MSKKKLRNRQRTYMSTQMRIVIGASIFAAASLLLIVVFNLSDVKETRAFSSGDYRTIASGDWSDTETWQVYDGKDWSEAAMPPGTGTQTIVVSEGTELILTEEVAVSNIVIDEGGTLKLETNSVRAMKSNGKGSIVVNGTISFGDAIIEGDADFIAGNKATIMIGSGNGIDRKGESGNIQLKGKKEWSKEARYIFNGSVLQRTGNGLPSILRNLVIDNASGVEMDQSIFVLDELFLNKGNLYTGRYTLTLGTSAIATGEVKREAGAVCGKFKRWYGPANFKDVSFPVSDASSVNVFSFTSELPEYQKGMIELQFHEGSLEMQGKNPFEARQVVVGITEKGYYTALLSNGPEEAWLKITSALSGSNNENKVSWKIGKSKTANTAASGAPKPVPGRVENTEFIQNILVGPNPFKEKFFVRFFSEANTLAHIQLMNGSGQVIYSEQMKVEEGSNQFEYVAKQDLPPGIYVLRISNASEIHTMKVIRDK